MSANRKQGRGRPPKERSERKDVDLRIPVTAEQKELIVQAARLEGEDMATWVRPIVMQAVQRRLTQNEREQPAGVNQGDGQG